MSTVSHFITFSLFLRFTFCTHHICDGDPAHAPCNWNCNENTQCTNDIFTCNSSSGCILNCATSSCTNTNIHKYGIGIMNVVCNQTSSCNHMNITNHNGYIYVLCQSHASCSNLNIHCLPDSYCFQSYTNITILSNKDTDKHDLPLHQSLISQLSLYQFFALSALILICVVINLLFCFWCLCCRKCKQSNKIIHYQTNKQCIESLKHSNNTHKNTYYDNDEDAQYTETLKKHSNESIDEYVAQETHEAYLVSLKPPHDYNNDDIIQINDYNNDEYIQNNDYNEYDVTEHNDLADAPCLDLGDLDESMDDNHVTMRGDDADITFWKQLPSSPKKQELIDDEAHDFKDSDEADDTQQLNEDIIPNISNDGTLPIENDKTEDVDFELLNSKKKPFELSIISPRHISDESAQIGRFIVNENGGNHVINEQKEHHFVENDEEQILNKLSSSKTVDKKGNMSSRRNKQSSREMMSVLNEMNDMKVSDDHDSDIIKFSVNGNGNSLKPMKENVPEKAVKRIHKFSGNLKFINDEEQNIQNVTKYKENKIHFAMLFSSPKANSPSISSRNINAISPRKIIDSIIKKSISPRNHELLLCQNDDHESDDDNVYKQHIDYDECEDSNDDLELLNSMRKHDML